MEEKSTVFAFVVEKSVVFGFAVDERIVVNEHIVVDEQKSIMFRRRLME